MELKNNLVYAGSSPGTNAALATNINGVTNMIASNNTFLVNDTSAGAGYGLYITSGNPVLYNNIISHLSNNGNQYGIYGGYDAASSGHNCIWAHGTGNEYANGAIAAAGDCNTATSDPLFTTGPNGEYYLSTGSPAIDTGSDLAINIGLDGLTTQIDGSLDTNTVDMGYHYEN